MTKEELKRQLHSYRDLKAESEQVAELLAEIQSKMTSPRGAGSDGMPHGSGSGDPMFGVVSRYIDLQQQYQSLQQELVSAQAQIEELIGGLDSRRRRLMRYYYIERKTWEQVCVTMNYGWAQVHRIHNWALSRILERCNNKDEME